MPDRAHARVAELVAQCDDPGRARVLCGLWQSYLYGKALVFTYRLYLAFLHQLLSTFTTALVALFAAVKTVFEGA